MCKCFDEMLSKVKEMAVGQLSSTPMVDGSLVTNWKNRVFILDGKQGAPVVLNIETEYRPLKKDGTPMKNKKKLENGFVMSYCPFCGGKYE